MHACVYVCVSEHVRLCVRVRMHVPLCVCVCICAHRCACTYVSVCGGWVNENACVVSVPASSPPWKPSLGLACMPLRQPCSYSNFGAFVSAAEPLLLNHWLLLNM